MILILDQINNTAIYNKVNFYIYYPKYFNTVCLLKNEKVHIIQDFTVDYSTRYIRYYVIFSSDFIENI